MRAVNEEESFAECFLPPITDLYERGGAMSLALRHLSRQYLLSSIIITNENGNPNPWAQAAPLATGPNPSSLVTWEIFTNLNRKL